MTKLTLPYPPSVNNLYATFRNRRIVSREGRAFKDRAAVVARAAGLELLDGEISVSVDVFRPRKAGDLDGRLKAILDCLTGVAWHDDKQVTHIVARRFDDKLNPRAEVTIRRVVDLMKESA